MSETQIKTWDLIYVIDGDRRTVSLGVLDGENSEMVGPFPALEAGPQIVKAIIEHGLETAADAEMAYIARHMANMARGINSGGQSYPYMVSSRAGSEEPPND